MNTPRCSPGTDWPRDSGQARGGAATGQGQWEVTATSPACRGRSDTPPVLPWSTVLCPDPDDLTRRHSVLRTGPCTWPLSAASRHGDRPAVGPPGNSGGCLSRPECGSDRLAGSGRFVSLRGMKHLRSPEPDGETEARREPGVLRGGSPSIHPCTPTVHGWKGGGGGG